MPFRSDTLLTPPPSPPNRAWEDVLAHVEALLSRDEVGPGDHLPSERALAAELGVGRSSVREAFRVLEVLGLVRTQTGSGPGAGAIIVARPSGGMAALMRLQVAARGFDARSVVKTRLVLERAVVGDLAEASPPADLSAAVALLDAMDRVLEDATTFLALDARFHVALAEATGNEVIAATMAGLRSAVERYVLAGAPTLASWTATAVRLAAEHRAIVAAVEACDAAAATELMRIHITDYYAATDLPR